MRNRIVISVRKQTSIERMVEQRHEFRSNGKNPKANGFAFGLRQCRSDTRHRLATDFP